MLSQTPVFQAFAPDALDHLAARLVERRFAHGQLIFGRGEPGSCMMLVIEGRVRLGATSQEGREVLFGIAGPGEVFGEVALLDGGGRSSDATALGACRVLSLDRRDLLPVLRSSPEAAIEFFGMLCGRLRTTNERLEGAVLLTVGERLARLLLTFAERDGSGTLGASLPSQADLGRLIGASRQKINLHLRRWVEEEVLRWNRRRLEIIDQERLAEIAGLPCGETAKPVIKADRLSA